MEAAIDSELSSAYCRIFLYKRGLSRNEKVFMEKR